MKNIKVFHFPFFEGLFFLGLKNVKFGIYKEELIMVITQNNELEVYDYRGDSQIIHALDSKFFIGKSKHKVKFLV